jgi:hypothetical protein
MANDYTKKQVLSLSNDEIKKALIDAYFDGNVPVDEDKHALNFLLETAVFNIEELKSNSI